MQVTALAIEAVKLIAPKVFADGRGHFLETYSSQAFAAAGIDDVFVQDNQSLSRPSGVVRGLHFQLPPHAQAKLVRALRGAIYDVAVDLRQGSPTYGRHVGVELSAANKLQLYVPVGFAHGFCTLEPDTEVAYKVTSLYAPSADRSLKWDDPQLAIAWPVGSAAAIVSDKDARAPLLAELPPAFA